MNQSWPVADTRNVLPVLLSSLEIDRFVPKMSSADARQKSETFLISAVMTVASGARTVPSDNRLAALAAPAVAGAAVVLVLSVNAPTRIRFGAARGDFQRIADTMTSAPVGTDFPSLKANIGDHVGTYTITRFLVFPIYTFETPLAKRDRPNRILIETGSTWATCASVGFEYSPAFTPRGLPLGDGWYAWQGPCG